jgi:hypothetical protein
LSTGRLRRPVDLGERNQKVGLCVKAVIILNDQVSKSIKVDKSQRDVRSFSLVPSVYSEAAGTNVQSFLTLPKSSNEASTAGRRPTSVVFRSRGRCPRSVERVVSQTH